jgi:glucosylceramidase
MSRLVRRVMVPAVWLALGNVGCGESSDPKSMTLAPVGSNSGDPSATTTSSQSAVGPLPSTTGATGQVGPTGATTAPGTTSASGGSGVAPSPSVSPVAPSVNPAPTGTTGGTSAPTTDSENPAPTGTDNSSSTGSEEPPPDPVVEPALITSGENNYWQIGEPTMGSGAATVTVSPDQEQNDWHGFGGTFNEAGWEALSVLSAEDREKALRLLFDANEGAAFTMARIPIGSSDYGLSRYSLNDSQTPDPEMNNFSLDRDRMHLIPYIKAALEIQPDLVMWGSPWSPPPWMKSNNAFDRGNMLDEHFAAHALYLARFVEDYAKEGINVVAVQPQNEPGYLQDYPSCGWTGAQMTTYIRDHLGPLFAERLPDTQVWLGTLSNPQSDHAIGQAVVANAEAKAFLSGVGMQWGMQQHLGFYRQQGLTVMQTEHQCGNFPPTPRSSQYESSPAPNNHAYALESWGLLYNWINGGVSAYLAWNMVLDTFGTNLDAVRPWNQNALLAVDTGARTLKITPTYYVFRHLAQYVEPGAKRVAAQGGQALAFKNPDGSVVTVLHNDGGAAAQTTLAVGSRSVQFEVPARGWATVNLQPE